MKALVRDRYGSPAVLRLEEMPIPQPGPGEVRLRVAAASINTADLDHLTGRPRIARVGTGLGRPRWRVPGFDVAGVVDEVGPDVTRLEPGDAVWADLFSAGHGAFAEYVVAAESVFAPMPPGVGFEDAASVPHSGTLALQAISSRGGVAPGQSVLVNGAGGCVGPFAIQIAKNAGAEVTAVDHSGKFGVMRAAGADRLVDFQVEDVTRSKHRFQLIVDIAAQRRVTAYRRILEPGGSYVQIARTLGGFFSAAVFGGLFGGSRKMGVFMWVPNRHADLVELGRRLQDGRLVPVLDGVVPLEGVPDAMTRLAAGDARGKIVVSG